MAMDDVVQRVARAMCRAAGFDDAPDCVELEARAAIAEVLDIVDANLIAVQYEPAPYTAMKARLAAIRREVVGE